MTLKKESVRAAELLAWADEFANAILSRKILVTHRNEQKIQVIGGNLEYSIFTLNTRPNPDWVEPASPESDDIREAMFVLHGYSFPSQGKKIFSESELENIIGWPAGCSSSVQVGEKVNGLFEPGHRWWFHRLRPSPQSRSMNEKTPQNEMNYLNGTASNQGVSSQSNEESCGYFWGKTNLCPADLMMSSITPKHRFVDEAGEYYAGHEPITLRGIEPDPTINWSAVQQSILWEGYREAVATFSEQRTSENAILVVHAFRRWAVAFCKTPDPGCSIDRTINRLVVDLAARLDGELRPLPETGRAEG